MSSTVAEVITQLDSFLANPTRIQQTMVDHVEDVAEGRVKFVDPSNPVVATLEAASVISAAVVQRNDRNIRRLYPASAQTYDDLYYHMSDKDYMDRFAKPSQSKFSLMFRKDEILAKMVEDVDTGYRKVVIPRNSYFTITETRFAIEYPIEIRQQTHGGLSIVYDTSETSPIQELSTNLVTWEERFNDDGNTYIWLEFDTIQVSVESQLGDLNSSTRFSTDIALTDQYYYSRVYIRNDQGVWIEIPTTHSQQVYDIDQITAVLRYNENVLTVSIPEIYTANATNSRKIRIDVYETKGPLNILLNNYPNSAFTATWYAIDPVDQTIFTAPMTTLETSIIFSRSIAMGGRDGLSFAELKERLISNAVGTPKIPISNVQIEKELIDEGYEIVKNIDVITNRVYLATRDLPDPTNKALITPAAASIQTGLFTIEEAVKVSTVIDNGNAITITPETLYQNVNGRIVLVSTDRVNALMTMPIEVRAIEVNANNYFYSPFHYVLDHSAEQLAVRPYFLDKPEIQSKVFVGENQTTQLQVTTSSYRITKSPLGYKVRVETTSSDNFKAIEDYELYAQMSYKPMGQRDYAFQNGVLLGRTDNNELIFEFDLATNFNVTTANGLELTKFLQYTTDPKNLPAELFHEFDIVYATTAILDSQYSPDAVDEALGMLLLPTTIKGITHERLRIRFGYFLERLWARGRSVITTAVYKRYTTDIPLLYTTNVYQRNPDDDSTIIWVDGQPTQILLHAKGDQVLDVNNQPIYQFREGDVMEDVNGSPIVTDGRGMYRQVDFMLIEGAYWFATDSITTAYRDELTAVLVDWITLGLNTIQQKLLDQTRIYFYPKTTTGLVEVMVLDGVVTTIEAGQSFNLTLHLDKSVFKNDALKKQLKVNSISTISTELKKSLVSLSRTISDLITSYAGDVINVSIDGLGGNKNYQAITIMNDTDRLSIRKRLVAQPDGFLVVEEAVELNYIRHELEQ